MVSRRITPRIVVLDNHDEAYHVWKDAGVMEATVVHVDAHHDLFEPKGRSVPGISDYLRWTLREGIAQQVYWVIPSPAWKSASGHKNILNHLRSLSRSTGGGRWWFKPEQRIGQAIMYSRPVTACSAESLPATAGPLLLDVDVDYLLLRVPPIGPWHRVPDRPWIWPGELAAELADLSRRSDQVTICYSVAGGYTPLMWKHLGDDLAAILAADLSEETLAYADLKKRMAEALLDSDTDKHEELRKAAEDKNPQDASLHHWRALAHLRSGEVVAAREAQAQAVELDGAYASSFGCCGPIFEAHGDFEGAEKAYREATELNERESLGWYGLGRMALRKKDLLGAKQYLTNAAQLPNAPAEVHRELGALAEAEGSREEALRQYRAYLRLSFAGRSLASPPTTVPDWGYRTPLWAEGYSALARVYAAKGDSRLSANCYGQALNLTNPRLYQAARPILRKMAGATNVSVPQIAAAAAKSLFVATGLAVKHAARAVRRRLRAIGQRDVPTGSARDRLCPPIPVRVPPTRR